MHSIQLMVFYICFCFNTKAVNVFRTGGGWQVSGAFMYCIYKFPFTIVLYAA